MPVIALVTGGNRGIGLATARALADRGAHVVIGARREEAGRAAVRQVTDRGGSAEHVVLDVDDVAGVRTAARRVAGTHDRLDVLVNNAGILPEATAPSGSLVDVTLFERTFRTNVLGAVAVVEEFLPLLLASPDPRIVNVSSTMGSLADQEDPSSPYFSTVVPAYQASKAALNSLTIGLAKLLGDRATVTSVCPGFVQTDLAPSAREHAPLTAAQAAVVVADAALAARGTPTGRFVGAGGAIPW